MILLNNGIEVPFLTTPKRQSILEHMKMSKIERQEHCNLDSPCHWQDLNVNPNATWTNHRYPKGFLSIFLNTGIPDGKKNYIINGIKSKIQAAHICSNQCFNPLHLYWATHQENTDDKKIDYYKLYLETTTNLNAL
jgi:hypothetical protein